MEWVETTNRTVDEAKDYLLDQLGVDEDEAEFEILEEPKAGLFGRVRGQARVRARVKPKAPRAKEERRGRKPRKESASSSSDSSSASGGDSTPAAPAAKKAPAQAAKAKSPRGASVSEAPASESSSTESPSGGPASSPRPSAEEAARLAPILSTFLEELLTAFGASGTVTVTVAEDNELEASIDGDGLGRLIGPGGGVLEALQELGRTVVQKNTTIAPSPRLRLDIAGYRAGRRSALEAYVQQVVADVIETGKPHVFEVMGASDRKVVHDAAAEVDGVSTLSEGEDPQRRVVLVASA